MKEKRKRKREEKRLRAVYDHPGGENLNLEYSVEDADKFLEQMVEFASAMVKNTGVDAFNAGFLDSQISIAYQIMADLKKLEEVNHRKYYLMKQSPLNVALSIENDNLTWLEEKMNKIRSEIN